MSGGRRSSTTRLRTRRRPLRAPWPSGSWRSFAVHSGMTPLGTAVWRCGVECGGRSRMSMPSSFERRPSERVETVAWSAGRRPPGSTPGVRPCRPSRRLWRGLRSTSWRSSCAGLGSARRSGRRARMPSWRSSRSRQLSPARCSWLLRRPVPWSSGLDLRLTAAGAHLVDRPRPEVRCRVAMTSDVFRVPLSRRRVVRTRGRTRRRAFHERKRSATPTGLVRRRRRLVFPSESPIEARSRSPVREGWRERRPTLTHTSSSEAWSRSPAWPRLNRSSRTPNGSTGWSSVHGKQGGWGSTHLTRARGPSSPGSRPRVTGARAIGHPPASS